MLGDLAQRRRGVLLIKPGEDRCLLDLHVPLAGEREIIRDPATLQAVRATALPQPTWARQV
jgi:hypothetical protein